MKPKNPAAVALGRLGGSANTVAQNEARRLNGRKGGRPKKEKLRLSEARCTSAATLTPQQQLDQCAAEYLALKAKRLRLGLKSKSPENLSILGAGLPQQIWLDAD